MVEDICIWLIVILFIVGILTKSVVFRFVIAALVLIVMIFAASSGVPTHSEFTDKPLDSEASHQIRRLQGK